MPMAVITIDNSFNHRLYIYMLNKNSLGLLKKGAAKQSRIKKIEAPVRARAQPVVK